MEHSIKKEVWEGKIPVCFSVDEGELDGGTRNIPEPCYLMVPRVSYFPFLYDKLEKLFEKAVNPSREDEMWLSFETVPLKWHYPVGVLYDLHGRGSRLPWNITVHYKNFPEEELLHYQGKEAMSVLFRSRVKEADNLKHRCEVSQSLTPQDYGQLWHGLVSNTYDEFWGVNSKLMLNIRGDPEPFRFIPFYIYREGNPIFQKLIAPVSYLRNEDSDEKTEIVQRVGDLFKLYDPEWESSMTDYCVLIHGIEVSLSVPLQWLSESLSYPDNFLHLCIVPNLQT